MPVVTDRPQNATQSHGPTRTTLAPAIEIQGVSKWFRGHLGIGKSRGVIDLDLTVHRGETFGLLGPNGAGKTTILKLLMGLLRPDQGSIRLLGQPHKDLKARASIGYLPENPYFYDYLTAEEFLDFYARLQGIPAAQRRTVVHRTLQRVGLAGREHTALRKFSKGMVQRLGLAQAIQHDPELVILDEPMSGLDPIGRREVRDLIVSLRQAGKTVFFSSHILQDAEAICDRVAILREGRVASLGALGNLISRDVRWYEVEVRGPQRHQLPGRQLSDSGDTTLLQVDTIDLLAQLISQVQAGPSELVSIWPRKESLEDLFLREVRGG